jgi:competence protein ComEC
MQNIRIKKYMSKSSLCPILHAGFLKNRSAKKNKKRSIMRDYVIAIPGIIKKTITAWLAVESRRLFNWIPVGLALGIALYFSLKFEPDLWVGPAAAAGFAALAAVGWRQTLARLVFLGLLTVSLGFFSAGWRTHRVAAPQLASQSLTRHLEATVEAVQKSPDKPQKLILLNPSIAGLEPAYTPQRLSITIRTASDDLAPGDVVGLSAVMMPPAAPAMPGAFDFARQAYFQGIGAVGFTISPVVRLHSPPKTAPSLMESFNLGLEEFRLKITRKFINGIAGGEGGLAAALTTGIRDGIPANVVNAMRNSGLAHLLAISGLHMGLVTGVVFFFTRAFLAAIPSLALNYPIKKWAAFIAAIAAIGYLLISGASLPTIRAFAMGGLVFVAVMLDRNPISMRLLALAAIVIFALKPEALLNVSFQMSFAAVAALIACYEALHGPITRWTSKYHGFLFKFFLYFMFISITSAAATVATAPMSIYHFNQVAIYAVLSNILAIPLVGFWVVPWMVIAFILMPFHLESLAMAPLGFGLKLLILIAEHVSSLPEAVLNLPGFSVYAFGVIALGGVWLCLWRTPLRLAGLAIMAAGVMMSISEPRPDILLDSQGKLIAVKGEGGRYLVSNLRSGKFSRDLWLRGNAQATTEKWPIPVKPRKSKKAAPPAKPVPLSPDPSLTCDLNSCLYAPWKSMPGEVLNSDMPRIILYFGKEFPLEDCGPAALIVSASPLPVPCPDRAFVIDRFNTYYFGSQAVWISRDEKDHLEFRMASAASERGNRPWTNSPAPPAWLLERSRKTEFIWNNNP